MSRTTIKTIAAQAGVSTATVDRVLNGRAGVTAANRQRVFAAAKTLGYLPLEGMVVLPARPTRLAFLIPKSSNAFLADVTRHIIGFANTLPMVQHCEIVPIDGHEPQALEAALETLSLETQGVGIITTDHPRCRIAIARLCEAGVRVVTIASDVLAEQKSSYVGIDNFAAGRTAAQLMGLIAGGQAGSVAVFLGSHDFHGHRERERGFKSFIHDRCPSLRILPVIETAEQRARARASMRDLMASTPDLRGVYCIGAGRHGIVEAMGTNAAVPRPKVIMHDLTSDTRRWLREGQIDVVIDQNAPLIAEQAVIRLLGAIATPTPLLQHKNIETRIMLRENL